MCADGWPALTPSDLCLAVGLSQFNPMTMQNMQMNQPPMGTRASSPMNHPVQINMSSVPPVSCYTSRWVLLPGIFPAWLVIWSLLWQVFGLKRMLNTIIAEWASLR